MACEVDGGVVITSVRVNRNLAPPNLWESPTEALAPVLVILDARRAIAVVACVAKPAGVDGETELRTAAKHENDAPGAPIVIPTTDMQLFLQHATDN